ncbi:MAG: response regulator transcription factor [Acidobacteriota bacterium]|nr:response regulator transcription factor [Acidobacteriota bacterium]
MKSILLIDDEPAVADVAVFALREAGFDVHVAGTLAAGKRHLRQQPVDLLILDLGLPDGDGLEFCRELRHSSRLPVLMLTCRDGEIDRVLGLEIGADDYVVKPFSPRELAARVRSILRRAEASPATEEARAVEMGRLTIDRAEHRVLLDETEIHLTPTEFEVLLVLASSPRRVFPRAQLIERAYSGETFLSDRAIDSHVKGIRRKFQSVDPRADPIETVHGVGYRVRGMA